VVPRRPAPTMAMESSSLTEIPASAVTDEDSPP
jgi:hypothetical protein